MGTTVKGKVAIVTGGGTGIGRAVSLLLASQGAMVAVIYSRSAQDAQDTVRQVDAAGGEAIAIRANVAADDEVASMIDEVLHKFGRIDYLVNNAGITHQMTFEDLDAISDEAWDTLYAVNVKGAFHCSRAAAPHLKKHTGSAIVNIGSIAGETGYGSSLPYAVSKAAMHGLTRSLARALAPEIRVNCLAPGAVQTRWWSGKEEKMRALAGNLALNRISTPADIAETVLLLLTAESMTGQIVKVENGQTL
ncbi:SDR family NAD(P)-dependent oxidoreductase [Noviherbaspirillum saxi]|uniref:SDR family oxidoreductase n=1 Tax=Noviherbaspirillum saxi TaxID=2320863 RepID=A0A3A3FKQ8_9BURK|nr:SDR family oxidoreductase [Noviherbaspirillum saxi]RJF91925.1 SDR family oxidoreductase [Noviherbaspirillum saxi]